MADHRSDVYAFSYSDHSVYGHVVQLLSEHGGSTGVHLDLGCGFGAIAEKVREAGLTYIGLDQEDSGLANLRARGFETGLVDLHDVPAAVARLQEVLAGRQLASVTLLDTLEHLVTGPELLSALHDLAGPTAAPLVVSVPNIAHRDIALKLLTGRFDYTSTGLLDETHLVHHTEQMLDAVMVRAGWREVGQRDLRLERSDQYFPTDHATLAETSTLHAFLTRLRSHAAPHADTNQFVRAYLPGSPRPVSPLADPEQGAESPFLTVVVRTQGKRQETLRDAFLCLQSQTDQDFDVVVAAHRTTANELRVVRRVVEDLPPSLRRRVRVLPIEGGGRARPLNEAFSAAQGRYVAVLDDDDLVFAHWVESFAGLAARVPGQLLRAVCVEQPIEPEAWGSGREGARSLAIMTSHYPDHFDLLHHMERNRTPFMAYAFPRNVFRDLGLRFDETIDVCEDWDYELRVALLVGVASTHEVTCVYRRWARGISSASLYTEDEWRRTERAIVSKIDGVPHLFPPGTMTRIREAALEAEGRTPAAELEIAALVARNHELEEALVRMERSHSWRVTRPLRAVVNGLKRSR